SLDQNIPDDIRNDDLHPTVGVGSEVRLNIVHVGLRYDLLANVLEFASVIDARWADTDGNLWAIVHAVRVTESIDADHAREFLGCRFLSRPHMVQDPNWFRAVRAADAKAEHVVAQMRRDMRQHFDDVEYLHWLDSQDSNRA